MEEQKRNGVFEEEVSKEEQADDVLKEAAEKAQKALSDAKEEMIRTIYNSIDYRHLFSMVGQGPKFNEFMEYVNDYEAKVKEADDTMEIDAPKMWHEFLDNSPIDAKTIGLMWDYIISFVINVSIASSQTINGVVYDNVIVPQFERVQEFNENIAHTIGQLAKAVDVLDQKINSLSK